jgi:hypothetical protein
VLYFDAIVPISPLRFRSAARYRGVMVMPGRALIIVGAHRGSSFIGKKLPAKDAWSGRLVHWQRSVILEMETIAAC